MSSSILLVDDDPGIRNLLAAWFERQGYRFAAVGSGREMRDWMKLNTADLVLLDLNLPGESGFDLAKWLRFEDELTPIIMLTERTRTDDRVKGLDLGADDYVAKPFELEELAARVRSTLRRAGAKVPGTGINRPEKVLAGTVELRPQLNELVGPQGRQVLSPKETALLLLLMQREGRPQSREMLLSDCSVDQEEVLDRTIDYHIHNIRRKLSLVGGTAVTIETVRGIGYVLKQADSGPTGSRRQT